MRELDLQVAGVEAGDVEQLVDDLRQPFRLGRDVAEERPSLLVAEGDVLAQQRLGEAVDGGERRAELVRDRSHEVRLHLLDHAVRRDIAEREDPSCHGAEWIEHHGFTQRQPHFLAATLK